jgi:hypothetical protein
LGFPKEHPESMACLLEVEFESNPWMGLLILFFVHENVPLFSRFRRSMNPVMNNNNKIFPLIPGKYYTFKMSQKPKKKVEPLGVRPLLFVFSLRENTKR